MRECIKPEEMCCLALRYFASGESFRSLEHQFRISRKAISYIVEQVAAAIIKILGETYLKTPNTTDEWVKTSQKLEFSKWTGRCRWQAHCVTTAKKLWFALSKL